MEKLIIGKNWISGSDETSLRNVEKVSEFEGGDPLHKFKFNEGGFLTEQGITREADSPVTDVSVIADHGYIYVASKEMFLYGDKVVEITDPEYETAAPEYIEVALADELFIGTDNSGIPSGIPYSVFDMGTPKLMSPMIVYEYPTPGPKTIIRNEKLLNEIDRSEITIPDGKVTGFEEPIAEIYESPKVRELNRSKNDIINPDNYIYDLISGKLWVRGTVGRVAVEYENSPIPRVKLGRDFSASRVGRDSGLLVLTTSKEDKSEIKSSRANITTRGSSVFIKQPDEATVEVELSTVYSNSDGEDFTYRTIENNGKYALISIEDVEEGEEIYIENVLVGTASSDGTAIVPVLGKASEDLHGKTSVSGQGELRVFSIENSPYKGRIKITITDPENGDLIASEIFEAESFIPNVSVGSAERRTIFIAPGTEYVEIESIVRTGEIFIQDIHETYRKNVEKALVEDIEISSVSDSVRINFESVTTGSYLDYYTYNKVIVEEEGSGFYGLQ